ncbi:hypothetical protein RFI_01749 [Reticulomyxa filosa]|uniref:Uncharacterized protein n=1 Tax=Reticulomyxa filosa TaxID=46433 RepID=X6PB63_RETFI|nr:hypothetical protein RFI_01749 [Reticulomyxa filosa]|eukprot:ETO35314.1 hypothetical protein RFI_01749 [Reticulomyxa filosa]
MFIQRMGAKNVRKNQEKKQFIETTQARKRSIIDEEKTREGLRSLSEGNLLALEQKEDNDDVSSPNQERESVDGSNNDDDNDNDNDNDDNDNDNDDNDNDNDNDKDKNKDNEKNEEIEKGVKQKKKLK